MTNKLEILERSPVSTSVRPSLKYSWSGSLLMLTKGRTTMEDLSGSGSAAWGLGIGGWVLGVGKKKYWVATTVPAMSNRLTAATTPFRGAMPIRRCCVGALLAAPFLGRACPAPTV